MEKITVRPLLPCLERIKIVQNATRYNQKNEIYGTINEDFS